MQARGGLRRPGGVSKLEGPQADDGRAQPKWPAFGPKLPCKGKEVPSLKPEINGEMDCSEVPKPDNSAPSSVGNATGLETATTSHTDGTRGSNAVGLEGKGKADTELSRRERAKEVTFSKDVPKSSEISSYSMSKRVEALPDKWRLLPAFFESRGLVSQHLASYNYLITHELRAIVRAAANRLIKSDVDPAFFLEFLDIQVGDARLEESMQQFKLTPKVCRVRELSYSAPLLAEVEYSRGHEIVRRRGVCIGYIPVMVRSKVCALYGKTHAQIQQLGECPLDPGGYFIVKGTEKVGVHWKW